MHTKLTKTLLGSTAALCLLAATGQQAQAGTFYDGWNYSIDAFKDGTGLNSSGRLIVGQNSDFEFFGMAFKQTSDRLFFAFNSNLSLNGSASSGARNGRISYGDLFLNFTGSNFNTANADRDLFAVRFDRTNDTTVGLGLYGNVGAASLTSQNNGHSSLLSHTNRVASLGGSASYGDLSADSSYFNRGQAAYTNIAAPRTNGPVRLGDVAMLNDTSDMGLDFQRFGATGKYTFGFSIDRSSLPNGNFIANLFAECGNDGVALNGEVKDVPEPSALAGLTFVGLVAGANRWRRRKDKAIA